MAYEPTTVTIELNAEVSRLLAEYSDYTKVPAETYIQTLVEQTLPTLKAMVECFDKVGDDEEAMMEMFGQKMGEAILAQRKAAEAGDAQH